MNPAYQSVLAAGVEKKYRHLENEVMKDVVRRIQKAGKITSTADWQLQRYMILGHSTEDVENIVRSAVGSDYADTFRLYDEVVEQEYVRSRTMYEQVNAYFVPYEQNLELQLLTNALIRQSNDELFNITKSMGFMVSMGSGRKVFTPLSEYYNDYLDHAVTELASGAFDYNTLVRKVVGQMTASGLRTVEYASGHSNRIDVAARRALLTGMGQLAGHISDYNAAVLGTDFFEVDWHPGARPEHSVWQGKVWSKEELVTVCGLGTGPGLLGWNCRHTYYPFIKGVSARTYTDEWLADMDRKESRTKDFRGKEYNAYQATQKQRQMETAMRAQRQKVQLLQEGKADPDDIMIAKCKYQAQLDEYKEFSKKFNLPEQRERIYADLKGRVAPSQRAYRQWQAEQERKARERAEQKRRADMRTAEKRIKGHDVTHDFLRIATPGVGKITYAETYDVDAHSVEVNFAKWLHRTFGGEIQLLQEVNIDHEKTADYLWNQKLWDLKTSSSEKSANSAIRHGLKQIMKNPGGIFLDFGDKNPDMDILEEVIRKRMQWRKSDIPVDILIISKGVVKKVIRY